MKILGLDTTRKSAIIFLVDGNKKHIVKLKEEEKQSENLLIKIDELLNTANVKLTSIDSFSIVEGPGSFTGIRVGMSTIKAFAYALNKPVVAVKIFDVVKSFVQNGLFLTECTGNSSYFARISGGLIQNVGVIDNSEIVDDGQLFCLDEEHIYNKETHIRDSTAFLRNQSELLSRKNFPFMKN